MKKYVFITLCRLMILLTALIVMGTCSQDAIFNTISNEQPPKNARITNPTNMVEFSLNGYRMAFVGSGTGLHWYAKPKAGEYPRWDLDEHKISNPGGNIYALAATDNFLYILTDKGVKRIDSAGVSDSLTPSGSGTVWQTVYAAGSRIFVGIGNGNTNPYNVLYLDDYATDLMPLGLSNPGLLSGAVFDGSAYYISTGNGIFTDASGAWDQVSGSSGRQFMGIINLEIGMTPKIAAMEHDGQLWIVESTGLLVDKKMDATAYTALALYRSDSNMPQLLLASRQVNSNSNGYHEVVLGADGIPQTGFREPGSSAPSSVSASQRSQYQSSIGPIPVRHLFQVSSDVDPNMTLFAATQNSGLWSYRTEWNAEE